MDGDGVLPASYYDPYSRPPPTPGTLITDGGVPGLITNRSRGEPTPLARRLVAAGINPPTEPPNNIPPQATVAVPQPRGGNPSDPRNKIPVIRAAAIANGIDPDVAVRVAISEGLALGYAPKTGTRYGPSDGGLSGGAFQLYTAGGLGNDYQTQTGRDPLNPKNEDDTIWWSMKWAHDNGWWFGDQGWHGARAMNLPRYEGISRQFVGGQTTAPGFSAHGPGPDTGTSETQLAGAPLRPEEAANPDRTQPPPWFRPGAGVRPEGAPVSAALGVEEPPATRPVQVSDASVMQRPISAGGHPHTISGSPGGAPSGSILAPGEYMPGPLHAQFAGPGAAEEEVAAVEPQAAPPAPPSEVSPPATPQAAASEQPMAIPQFAEPPQTPPGLEPDQPPGGLNVPPHNLVASADGGGGDDDGGGESGAEEEPADQPQEPTAQPAAPGQTGQDPGGLVGGEQPAEGEPPEGEVPQAPSSPEQPAAAAPEAGPAVRGPTALPGSPVGEAGYGVISNAVGTTLSNNKGIDFGRVGSAKGGSTQGLTQMTIAQVANYQSEDPDLNFGGFQIHRSDLLSLAQTLHLDPNQTKFDDKTQKAMADVILNTKGAEYWPGFGGQGGQKKIDELFGLVFGQTKTAIDAAADRQKRVKQLQSDLEKARQGIAAAAKAGKFDMSYWRSERRRAFDAEKSWADYYRDMMANPPQRTFDDMAMSMGALNQALSIVGPNGAIISGMNALGALGEAMQARQKGEDENYKENWQRYVQFAHMAANEATMAAKRYNETLQGQDKDIAATKAELYPLTWEFEHGPLRVMLDNGDFTGATTLIDRLTKVAADYQKNLKGQEELGVADQARVDETNKWIATHHDEWEANGHRVPGGVMAEILGRIKQQLSGKVGKTVDPNSVASITQDLIEERRQAEAAKGNANWQPSAQDRIDMRKQAEASAAKASGQRLGKPEAHAINSPDGKTQITKTLSWDSATGSWYDPATKKEYVPPTDKDTGQPYTIDPAPKESATAINVRNRLEIASSEIATLAPAMTKLPLGTTLGPFGGAQAAMTGGPIDNFKKTLLNRMTPTGSQLLSVFSKGMGRVLATLVAAGTATGLSQLADQLQSTVPEDGDTGITRLGKYADMRRILDAAMPVLLNQTGISENQKNMLKDMQLQVHEAIPYKVDDIVALYAHARDVHGHSIPADVDVQQFAQKMGLGLPVPSWAVPGTERTTTDGFHIFRDQQSRQWFKRDKRPYSAPTMP